MKGFRFPGCRVSFALCGLNLERFLNHLQKEDIPLLRLSRPEPKKMICECFSADFPAIRALAQDRGWALESVKPLGVSALIERLKKRAGIPAGVLLGLIAALVLSRFVWQVEINGAGSYHAEIASYLKESGYVPGSLRSRIDAAALERALLYRYPELAWFQVYVSGVRMVVDVTPGVSMPQLPLPEAADLVASRSGIVESIQVHAGTPAVKAGDIVQKGQTLIRGIERSADEQHTALRARGTVMARCWDSYTVQIPLNEIHSEETGRERSQMRICTPLFNFPHSPSSPDFLAFNTYIEELPVVGCFFPVTCQRIVQREVSMQYVARDVEQVRAEAAQAALKSLKTKHFGDEIIDKWVDYCMIEDGSLAATATVEWLMNIGESFSP